MSTTYTVKQVAQILGYSTNSIYTFLKEKRIKGIRLGKGRFRISEEELARILHLSKKTVVLPTASSLSVSSRLINFTNSTKFNIPSLFDWFLGITSILLAAAMSLHNIYPNDISGSLLSPFQLLIQIVLTAGGIGILIGDVFGQKKYLWHNIFHLILAAAYASLTYLRFRMGEGGALALYGSLVPFILLHCFWHHLNPPTFTVFVFLDVIFLALIYLFKPTLFELPVIFNQLAISPTLFGFIWLVGGIIYTCLVFYFYQRKRSIYWLLMLLNSLFFLAAAIWYAQMMHWTKSIVILLVSLTGMFVPVWDLLQVNQGKFRKLVIGVFLGTLGFLLMVIGLISLGQKSLLTYARHNLADKLSLGESLITTNQQTIMNSLNGLANDPLFKEATLKGDEKILLNYLKGVYEGNRMMRRILVIQQDGDLAAIYPIIELTEKNFAFRDYFSEVMITQKPFISTVFQATDQSQSNVLVIAVPIVIQNKTKGVLVGSLDFLAFDRQLRKISDETDGEYFLVSDTQDRWLINPVDEITGEKVNEKSFLRRTPRTGIQVQETYNEQDRRIIAVSKRLENNGWIIGVAVPLRSVLQLTITTSLIIYGISAFMLVIALGIVFGTQGGWRLLKEQRQK